MLDTVLIAYRVSKQKSYLPFYTIFYHQPILPGDCGLLSYTNNEEQDYDVFIDKM